MTCKNQGPSPLVSSPAVTLPFPLHIAVTPIAEGVMSLWFQGFWQVSISTMIRAQTELIINVRLLVVHPLRLQSGEAMFCFICLSI